MHLAIDLGTTAVKAAVFGGDGQRTSLASRDNGTLSPQTGWAEQDMDAVWGLVAEVAKEAAREAGGSGIESIGVTGQGDGLWALDSEFRPVRNAILWNDQRAGAIVEHWSGDGTLDAIAKHCHTAIWPGANAAILRWLKDHDRKAYDAIDVICCSKDWIGYRLTDQLGTDFTDASIPFLDFHRQEYADDLFERCGIEECRSRVRAPELSATKRGSTTAEANRLLGLEQSVPVSVGALDIAAMHVGADLNAVGDSLIILGTTAVVSTVVEPFEPRDPVIGASVIHPFADRWLNVQAPQSGASAVDWLAGQFPDKWPDGAGDLIRAAEQAPAGSNGAVFLPYLTGERAPFVAPNACGTFYGVTSTTTAGDLARAILEGVAFSIRHCIDATGGNGGTGYLVTGGGARSRFWIEILASVLGQSVRTTTEEELGLSGAARLGALAAGAATGATWARNGDTTIEPRQEDRTAYEAAYRTYRDVLDALHPLWVR